MRIWFVDAFTDRVFSGSPAAVVPLERWLPDAALQAIAAENRLSETAFLTPTGLKGNYQLRWFTPLAEVPVCGHATLAAGAVLMTEIEADLEVVVFDTQAGALVVRKTEEGFTLDMPRKPRSSWIAPEELVEAIGNPRVEDAFIGEYANIVLDTEDAVRELKPDFAAIDRLVRGPRQGCLTVTAAADEGKPYDFVSRFFAPGVGMPEDPASGAAFADLAPYWSDRFDYDSVIGYQASKRGGYARAIQTLSSVRLLGQVAVYLRGELDASIARLHNRPSIAPDPLPRARRKRKQPHARGLEQAPIFEDAEAIELPDVPSPPAPPPLTAANDDLLVRRDEQEAGRADAVETHAIVEPPEEDEDLAEPPSARMLAIGDEDEEAEAAEPAVEDSTWQSGAQIAPAFLRDE
ncbi:MAG: PhzF family phenazine biosynthesis protein [Hyphomonadaceae bacterium]|nr:PhzF family phenazine biosynthesis protein [Hyphomonadaceae bacterium]